MATLHINPKYRALLDAQGMKTTGDFLGIQGVILWGHPDRTVQRVEVGGVPCFLKTEHRVRWKERWRNAWAGFGFVSRTLREWSLLNALHEAGVGCPEVIAAGELGARVFLLVREVEGSIELRRHLQRPQSSGFFIALGQAVAKMHSAGFVHPDLYSKHVLVTEEKNGWQFTFVDWQRGERNAAAGDAWRTLAKLDATLADELATPRHRAAFLHAYLRALGAARSFGPVARKLRQLSRRLQGRRQIQESRQRPLPAGMQHFVRIHGTRLYVTRDLPEKWARNVADWLNVSLDAHAADRQTLSTPHTGELVRHRSRGAHVCPDFENAAKLFRLQRFGVATSKLLAVGNRPMPNGETISFLLTELPSSTAPLREWMLRSQPAARHQVLKAAANLFRRIHRAGYFFDASAELLVDQFVVDPAEGNKVLWRGVEHLRRRFPLSPDRIRKDLAQLKVAFATGVSRSDCLRFMRNYLGLDRLTFSAKNLVRSLSPAAKKGRVRA